MPRPISAHVSHSALAHNLDVVRRRLHGKALPDTARTRVWAVIKANAYGHGIERAVAGFAAADGLAMLDPSEAVRCREAGWAGPIMLLEGIFDTADLETVDRYRLTIVVHGEDQLRLLESARFKRPVDAFVKLNSGMNRLGFAPADYVQAFTRVRALQQKGVLSTIGHMTHFATADTADGIEGQLARFRDVAQHLPGPVSVCNSAASLRYPEIAADWARPGVALYGSSPFADETAQALDLKPAMALRSAIIGVQTLQPGDAVGYGALFRADRTMRVGVVACGYADGYPRHAPTGTPMVVAGVRTRLLGCVSMDMIGVDLTDVPQARVGSPVTLWGGEGLSIDEVARSAGTIGYELMCAITPRVPMHTEQ
jgi:alanine racemase